VNGTVALSYDAAGRLHTVTASVSTTTFLYSGDELVAEYSGTTLIRRYVHGSGTDEPLVWYDVSGSSSVRHFLHADARGSIIAVTNDSGTATETFSYGPYGGPSDMTGSHFLYTGQVAIAEAGLYYYKARFYSPALGRFLQADPAGYDAGPNLYAYAGGDPINRTGKRS